MKGWEEATGALWLYKISRSSGTGTCREPACANSGRYQIFLAGYRCDSKFGAEVVCQKHADAIRTLFAELAPRREDVEQALADLSGPPGVRTDAVDTLRSFGLSDEACARAVKETRDGREPGEILDRLLGVELEPIAA